MFPKRGQKRLVGAAIGGAAVGEAFARNQFAGAVFCGATDHELKIRARKAAGKSSVLYHLVLPVHFPPGAEPVRRRIRSGEWEMGVIGIRRIARFAAYP
jgi:hypothetical protein